MKGEQGERSTEHGRVDSLQEYSCIDFLKYYYICRAKAGGLAQLARAFDWQSKGQRFDSAILHFENTKTIKAEHLRMFCFCFDQG